VEFRQLYLILSVIHPISKTRFETHVVVIRLKELPSGFRVLSAETVSIESFPDDQKDTIISNIHSFQTNQPENAYCVAIFKVENIDASEIRFLLIPYGVGTYSNLAAVQEEAATENGRQAELIQMLNKKS
jgi:hypothetical protein